MRSISISIAVAVMVVVVVVAGSGTAGIVGIWEPWPGVMGVYGPKVSCGDGGDLWLRSDGESVRDENGGEGEGEGEGEFGAEGEREPRWPRDDDSPVSSEKREYCAPWAASWVGMGSREDELLWAIVDDDVVIVALGIGGGRYTVHRHRQRTEASGRRVCGGYAV